MTKPQISIIMSVYNGEDYVAESVTSILLQKYKNFEFIIVNDGSTDNTLSILKEYMHKDKRIKLIDQENKGLTKSLNIAASKAQGKYIARQDADDISLPNRFTKQIRYLQRNKNVKFLGSSNFMIDSKGKVINYFLRPRKSSQIRKYMPKGNQICHGSIMMCRETFCKLNGYDESYRFAQDYELWFRALKEGYDVENLRQLLYLWRIHENSIAGAKQQKQRECVANIVKQYSGEKLPDQFVYSVAENFLKDKYYLSTSIISAMFYSFRYPQLKFTFLKKKNR